MGLFKSRNDSRRWSRRLVDDETRSFVEDVLRDSSEIFRTASGEFQLRGLCIDVFADPATTEVEWLKQHGIDGETFYKTEIQPSWDGLDQTGRAARIDRFIELSNMLGEVAEDNEPPEAFLQVIATVHLKVLLLAWAYDRTYSYMDRLFNGPLQYREHRYRIAGGRLNGGPPVQRATLG
jgi:hypothetical protein